MKFRKYALSFLVSSSLAAAFVLPASRTCFGVGQSQRCSVIFSEVGNEITEGSLDASPEAVVETPEIPDEIVDTSATDSVTTDSNEGNDSSSDNSVEEPPEFTVYISNMPYGTTDQEVQDLFAKFGTIKKLAVPRRRTDNGCRGFAFIDMSTEEEMLNAIEGTNGLEFAGRTLTAKKSLPKKDLPKRKRKTRVTPERLYVGNLPYGVSEAEVTELFMEQANGVGITDLFLVKDSDGNDRGFGFVTLESEEAVQPTIDSLDGFVFNGRRLAVRKPNPEGVKNPKVKVESERVYFGNLSFDTTTSEMRALFEEHGVVLNLYVNEDFATKASRGYGFAQMPKEDAQKAIEALNGTEVDGRIIKVCVAAEKIEKLRIYVGSLSFDTDEETVRSVFGEYGEVFSVILPKDSQSGGSRGFAILTMPTEEGKRAMEELNGMELDGRKIEVNEAQPKGYQASTTKIYIGNLDFDTPEEAVRDIFADYGEVKSCVLPEDKDFGGSRGFGFVTMDRESAKAAMDELDGIELDGRNIRVSEADGGRTRTQDNFDDEDGYEDDGYGDGDYY